MSDTTPSSSPRVEDDSSTSWVIYHELLHYLRDILQTFNSSVRRESDAANQYLMKAVELSVEYPGTYPEEKWQNWAIEQSEWKKQTKRDRTNLFAFTSNSRVILEEVVTVVTSVAAQVGRATGYAYVWGTLQQISHHATQFGIPWRP